MLWIAIVITVSTVVGAAAEIRSNGRAAELSRRTLLAFLYTLLPFIIFFNVSRAEIDLDRAGGIVFGWVALAIGVGVVHLVCSRLLHLDRVRTGTLMTCTCVSNTGYLGYPAVIALLGRDDLPDAVIYDLGVALPALLLGAFSIGAAFGTEAGETFRERVRAFFVRNPPLGAAVAGLIVPDAFAPDLLVDLARIFVIALLPVGFFAVGTLLGQAPPGERLPRPEPPIAVVAVAKIGLVPAVLALLAAPLFDLPPAYLLMAAMPSGLNSMIVAHAYGFETRLVAEAVVWTTAIVVVGAAILQLLGVL